MKTFFDKVNVGSTDDCWLWTGTVNSAGYGRLIVNKSALTAHRVAYEQYVGEIPPGATVRQTCEQKLCCNPWHLEMTEVKKSVATIGSTPKLDHYGLITLKEIVATMDPPVSEATVKRWISAKKLVPFAALKQYGGSPAYYSQTDVLIVHAEWVKGRTKVEPTGSRRISLTMQRAVLDRDGEVCHLCRNPIDVTLDHKDPWSLVIDHVIPWKKGGPTEENNLRPAHRRCNGIKLDGKWWTEELAGDRRVA